ncbi:MAG: hypothetical protein ACP5SI_02700 [Chloroflexia bacterium]
MNEAVFLGWFDDNPKKPVEAKIDEAVERYILRFGRRPNLCLVHREDCVAHRAVEVRVASHVRRHHFLVGYDPQRVPEAERARASGEASSRGNRSG